MTYPFGKIAGDAFVFRHVHFFCGMGSGAAGFNDANPRVGNITGRFECVGGVDNDAGALANFEALTGAPGWCADLFDEQQYRDFHGCAPPAGWKPVTSQEIRRRYGSNIDFGFLSAPCKGFSGLLSTQKSLTLKYQALNRLTVRGVRLLLEAYKDDPITVILFENVTRIETRGVVLLEEIKAVFREYGYVVADANHDCGEIGELAQSRKRYLLIARHPSKMPAFIYQPPKRRLRGVGEVIGKLPLPGDPIAGILHKVPKLQWQTWVRLAFVEAGKDWRSLQKLRVENGMLQDFGIMPEVELRDNALGVCSWGESGPLITGQRSPYQGRFSVADPRGTQTNQTFQQYGVAPWDEPINAVSAQSAPGGGRYAVADVRIADCQNGALGVRRMSDPGFTVRGRAGPTNGTFSIADPRPAYGLDTHCHVLVVAGWYGAAGTVNSRCNPTSGAFAVADVRVNGHEKSVMLGVRPWTETSPCVKGDMSVGTGPYAIADIRIMGRPRFNNTFRIVRFTDPGQAVAGPGGPAGGPCVADPRGGEGRHVNGKYRVAAYGEPSSAVIAASTTGNGAFAVADMRGPVVADAEGRNRPRGKYPVAMWFGPATAVIAGRDNGAFAVADIRCNWGDRHTNILRVTPGDQPAGTVSANAHSITGGQPCVADARAGLIMVKDPVPAGLRGDHRNAHSYNSQAHYGVVDWGESSIAVPGHAKYDRGKWSVGDPRDVALHPADPIVLPQPKDKLVCRIIALDETWHRPFTTMELCGLQSIVDPEEAFGFDERSGLWFVRKPFVIESRSDAMTREWVGNAVPRASAKAMAETVGQALILARLGETFTLSSEEIWVKPLALALSVDTDQVAFRMDGGLC
jgi:site-specific DNA-cytosine methylase